MESVKNQSNAKGENKWVELGLHFTIPPCQYVVILILSTIYSQIIVGGSTI